MPPYENDERSDEMITRHDDGSVTVRLNYPVKRGEETLDRLKLRRLTMGDMEATDEAKGAMGKTVILIARAANIERAVARRLDAIDFERIDGVLQRFLGREPSLQTGGTS